MFPVLALCAIMAIVSGIDGQQYIDAVECELLRNLTRSMNTTILSSASGWAAVLDTNRSCDGLLDCRNASSAAGLVRWNVTIVSDANTSLLGVECSPPSNPSVANATVLRLQLPSFGLGGTLPLAHIISFRSLLQVDFRANNLVGNLSGLNLSTSSIHDVCLADNNFSGTVPSDTVSSPIWNSGMYRLDLSGNPLIHGSLPLFRPVVWTALQDLMLGGNNFSGTIPQPWDSSPKLFANFGLRGNKLVHGLLPVNITSFNYDMGECNFTGEVPVAQWVKSTPHIGNTTSVYLDSNRLIGSVSPLFSKFSALQVLNIGYNHFNGTLPTELGSLSSMVEFTAHCNSFTGAMPGEYSNWSNVTYLSLAANNLNGTIPGSWCNMSSLTTLWLFNNSLSGSVPSCSSVSWPILQEIQLFNNNFNGALPLFQSTMLRFIQFLHNKFVGTIPLQWSTLPMLKTLILSDNVLNGSLPLGRNWTQLESLQVANCRGLNGSIPLDQWSTNMPSLKTIHLQNNSFSGALSEFTLTKLENFHVTANQLVGTIPNSLFQCSSLVELSLAINNFSGSLPENVANLTQLIFLAMDVNNLTGSIPSAYCRFTKIATFSVAANRLSGPIPACHSNWTELSSYSIGRNAGIRGTLPYFDTKTNPNLKFVDCSMLSVSGTVPSGWFTLENVFNLELTMNSLMSPSPVELFNGSQWRGMQALRLGGCNLYGSLNMSLWSRNMPILRELRVHNSKVTLDIDPVDNFTMPRLFILMMGACGLQGTVPDLKHWPSLQRLHFGQNMLTGTLPQSLCYLFALEELYLFENSLHGEVPPCVVNLVRMRMFLLNGNQLNGSLPAWDSSHTLLDTIFMSDNMFSGTIPRSWSKAPGLSTIILVRNRLEGSFPTIEFVQSQHAQFLMVVGVGQNRLNGSVPCLSRLGPWLSLKILEASGNAFSGTINPSIINANNIPMLFYLDISKNNLTGPLPTGLLSELPSLSVLNVSDNLFDGLLPEAGSYSQWNELMPGQFLGLVFVVMSRCFANASVQRTVPSSWKNLTMARVLQLSAVGLEGAPPPHLFKLPMLSLLDLSGNRLTDDDSQSLTFSTGLSLLNLSGNRLTSLSWVKNITFNKALLDVSFNAIAGTFPSIQYLVVVNASHNFLSGPLPQGRLYDDVSDNCFCRPRLFQPQRDMCVRLKCNVSETHSESTTRHLSTTVSASRSSESLSLPAHEHTTRGKRTTKSRSFRLSWASVSPTLTLSEDFSLTESSSTSPFGVTRSESMYGKSQTEPFSLSALPHRTESGSIAPLSISVAESPSETKQIIVEGTVLSAAVLTPVGEALAVSTLGPAIAVALPAGANALQDSLMVLSLSVGCENRADSSLPVFASPTQWRIAPDYNAASRGAVAGNILLCGGILCATYGVAWMVVVAFQKSPLEVQFIDLQELLARVGLPGRFNIVVSLLLQPTVTASVLLLREQTGPGDVVIGLLGLLLFAALPVASHVQIREGIVDVEAETSRRESRWNNWLSEVLVRHFSAPLLWRLADDVEPPVSSAYGLVRETIFLGAYGNVFGRLWKARFHYVTTAHGFSFMIGIAGGMRSVGTCAAIAWALLAITGLHMIVIATFRPFASPADFVASMLMRGLVLVACVVIAGGDSTTAEKLIISQLALLLCFVALKSAARLAQSPSPHNQFHTESGIELSEKILYHLSSVPPVHSPSVHRHALKALVDDICQRQLRPKAQKECRR